MKRTITAGLGALALAASLTAGIASAQAETRTDRPVIGCTPQDAWTETVEVTPAYDEEVLVSEEVPAVAEVWANFKPGRGFSGTPSYPTDPKGTWNVKDAIPGGHAGPDGVYQKGHGKGSWFYRQAGQEAIPAVYETIHHPAVTEEVEHPAVECEDETPEVEETEDPVVEEETRDEPGKTTKITKHESGKVTVDVVEYETENVNEEGL